MSRALCARCGGDGRVYWPQDTAPKPSHYVACPDCGGTGFRPTLKQRGMNPRALGTNPKALGTNPKALGTNPRALGTNPKALGTNPKALGVTARQLGLSPKQRARRSGPDAR